MKSLSTTIFLFLLPLVYATNYQVQVGFNGLVYTPSSVAANAGDTIEFLFEGSHTLTEAAFSAPCLFLNGGAYSGVSPQPNFVLELTNTSPRFFYSSISTDCQSGMVFALNPSLNETFVTFQSAAEMTNFTSQIPPGGIQGGISGAVPVTNNTGPPPNPTTEVTSPSPSTSVVIASTAASTGGSSNSVAAGSTSATGAASPSASATKSEGSGIMGGPYILFVSTVATVLVGLWMVAM